MFISLSDIFISKIITGFCDAELFSNNSFYLGNLQLIIVINCDILLINYDIFIDIIFSFHNLRLRHF